MNAPRAWLHGMEELGSVLGAPVEPPVDIGWRTTSLPLLGGGAATELSITSMPLTSGFSVRCPKSMSTLPSLLGIENDFIPPAWSPYAATMSKLSSTLLPSTD